MQNTFIDNFLNILKHSITSYNNAVKCINIFLQLKMGNHFALKSLLSKFNSKTRVCAKLK